MKRGEHFFEKKIQLTFPQLLQLRQRIQELSAPVKLTNIINNENFVLLSVADGEHLLFIEIPNLLAIKEELDLFFSVSVWIIA